MKKIRLMWGCRLLAWLAILAWLAGCSHFDPYRILWQDQTVVYTAENVGFAHVSVLSVAPWHEIEGMLQPSFDLTPEDARQRALPITVRWEEKAMAALIAKLGVGIDAPTHAEADASTLPGFSDWDKFEAANNPMLEYQLATALYQEVQILNNYVRYAAQSKGYQAFLVRLQVSIMPLAHDMPYDTYVNIGFTTEPEHLRQVVANQTAKPCPTSNDTPKAIPLLVTDSLEAAQTLTSAKRLLQAALSIKRPFDGESVGGELAAALDKIRTKAGKDLTSTMTVSRVWDNFLRARFGAVRTDEKTYAMVPRNHSISLLLLVPDCMFVGDKARLMVTSSADFADAFTGKWVTRNSSLDHLKALSEMSEYFTLCQSDLADTARICSYQQNQQQIKLEQLINQKLRSNCAGPPGNNFALSIRERLCPPRTPESAKDQNQTTSEVSRVCDNQELLEVFGNRWPWLWHGIASDDAYAQIQKTFLTLDQPPRTHIEKYQTPLLEDDSKEMVAYLSGTSLMGRNFRAFLSDKNGIKLPSNSIEAVDKGRRLRITFPSLARAGLAEKYEMPVQPLAECLKKDNSQSKAKKKLSKEDTCITTPKVGYKAGCWYITLNCRGDSNCDNAQGPEGGFPTQYTYRERPGGDSMVVLLPDCTQLTSADKGVDLGLQVYFDPPLSGGQVLLRMGGATLNAKESKLGGVLTDLGNGKFQVEKSGKAILNLSNLGKSVDFHSTLAGDIAGPPLSIGVIKPAAKKDADTQTTAGNSGVNVNITTNAPTQTTTPTTATTGTTTKPTATTNTTEKKK